MPERLTNEELVALMQRFPARQHPKLCAALDELLALRQGAWRPMCDWAPEVAAVAEFLDHVRRRAID